MTNLCQVLQLDESPTFPLETAWRKHNLTERTIQRARFEAHADAHGFDLTRRISSAHEPWSEYADVATGYLWAGWLACAGVE